MMVAAVSQLLFLTVKWLLLWSLGAAAIRAASKTMEKPASDVAPPGGGAENSKGSKNAEESKSPVAKVITLFFTYMWWVAFLADWQWIGFSRLCLGFNPKHRCHVILIFWRMNLLRASDNRLVTN